MVTKLLHTRMRVNDLERTVKFYEHALGLKVSRRHTSRPMSLWHLHSFIRNSRGLMRTFLPTRTSTCVKRSP